MGGITARNIELKLLSTWLDFFLKGNAHMHYYLYFLLLFLLYLIYQVEDISMEPHVECELMLIKLNADPTTRAEVLCWYEASIYQLGVANYVNY